MKVIPMNRNKLWNLCCHFGIFKLIFSITAYFLNIVLRLHLVLTMDFCSLYSSNEIDFFFIRKLQFNGIFFHFSIYHGIISKRFYRFYWNIMLCTHIASACWILQNTGKLCSHWIVYINIYKKFCDDRCPFIKEDTANHFYLQHGRISYFSSFYLFYKIYCAFNENYKFGFQQIIFFYSNWST